MTVCGSTLSVDCCQNNHVSPSGNDIPLSVRLPGVVGGVVSVWSAASVVTVRVSLSGERFPPKSWARTTKEYVVEGWSGPNVPDVFLVPDRTVLPFISTLNQTLGPSSTDD